jgi:hypothetical protein
MMRFLRACVNFFRLGHGNDHPDYPGTTFWLSYRRKRPGLSLFQVHIGVQRLGALGPLAVRAGICLQDRDDYGATITASK